MKKFLLLLVLLLWPTIASGTISFYYDAESGSPGDLIPDSDTGSGPWFCQQGCGQTSTFDYGVIVSDGTAPQGSNFFSWHIAANQHDFGTEVYESTNFPASFANGGTAYLAYYMRLRRVGGVDIYTDGAQVDSFDKGVEIWGSNTRWTSSHGQNQYLPPNADHTFTVFLGDPTYHFTSTEYFTHNQNGYTSSNSFPVEYDRWYAVVMGITFGCSGDGRMRLWINGTLVADYTQTTTNSCSGESIAKLMMGGTLDQPDYDIVENYHDFDALMLTDNFDDVQQYMADPEQGGGSSPPVRSNGAPTGTLDAGTTQVTMSLNTDVAATCKYGDDGVTDVAYESLPYTFSTTGGTTHSQLITELQDGQSYSRAVRCSNANGTNLTDYIISWSVAESGGGEVGASTGTFPMVR